MRIREQTLLSAVTAAGAGTEYPCPNHTGMLDVWIAASSVSSGAVVQVQAQSPNGDWHDLLDTTDQATIAANGNYGPFHAPVGYPNLRGNIISRTDGTYTVSILVRN